MSNQSISDSAELSLRELSESEEKALKEILKSNIMLHIIIEKEVEQTPFGQITFNMVVRNGVAMLDTINITKNRRKRYSLDK